MNNIAHLKATSPLQEWLCYLENSHYKAIDLGLERVAEVAKKLDLLKPAPFVITVGGTNGKGTTCRLLETILLNLGLRVGVYSSPHLLRYNERVRIQNQDLPDEQHTASFAFIEQHKSQSLSYFEFSTLSALHLFKQAKLDVVILEVGLGGRLDATNIVDNDMAIITSIGIDHIDFLGNSRNQIAQEKAGIFRANKAVIIGEPDIPQPMLQQAKALNCKLSCRNQDWQFQQTENSWCWQNSQIKWENLPLCQIPLANAATVLAAVQALPFEVSRELIEKSLIEVELVGRFQCIRDQKQLARLAQVCNKTVEQLPQIIIDVGHNPHAAQYLAEKLASLKSHGVKKIIAVCGILQDKDATGILQPLFPYIDYWHYISLKGYRGQTGAELQHKMQLQQPDLRSQADNDMGEGIKNALTKGQKSDLLLVFGSFHTIADFFNWLDIN